MYRRIVPALGALFAAITAHAHPGHPALGSQHVHAGMEIDVAWLALVLVLALIELAGIGRVLARSAARRRR